MPNNVFAKCSPDGIEHLLLGLSRMTQLNVDAYLDVVTKPLHDDVKLGTEGELFKTTKDFLGDVTDDYVNEYMFDNAIKLISHESIYDLTQADEEGGEDLLSCLTSLFGYGNTMCDIASFIMENKTNPYNKIIENNSNPYFLQVVFPYMKKLYGIGRGKTDISSRKFQRKMSPILAYNDTYLRYMNLNLHSTVPIGANDSYKPASYIIPKGDSYMDVALHIDGKISCEDIPKNNIKDMMTYVDGIYLASTDNARLDKLSNTLAYIRWAISGTMEEYIGYSSERYPRKMFRKPRGFLLENNGVQEDLSVLTMKGLCEIGSNASVLEKEMNKSYFSESNHTPNNSDKDFMVDYPYGYTGERPDTLSEWMEEMRLVEENGLRKWSFDVILNTYKQSVKLWHKRFEELAFKYENIVNSASDVIADGKMGNYIWVRHEDIKYHFRRMIASLHINFSAKLKPINMYDTILSHLISESDVPARKFIPTYCFHVYSESYTETII